MIGAALRGAAACTPLSRLRQAPGRANLGREARVGGEGSPRHNGSGDCGPMFGVRTFNVPRGGAVCLPRSVYIGERATRQPRSPSTPPLPPPPPARRPGPGACRGQRQAPWSAATSPPARHPLPGRPVPRVEHARPAAAPSRPTRVGGLPTEAAPLPARPRRATRPGRWAAGSPAGPVRLRPARSCPGLVCAHCRVRARWNRRPPGPQRSSGFRTRG